MESARRLQYIVFTAHTPYTCKYLFRKFLPQQSQRPIQVRGGDVVLQGRQRQQHRQRQQRRSSGSNNGPASGHQQGRCSRAAVSALSGQQQTGYIDSDTKPPKPTNHLDEAETSRTQVARSAGDRVALPSRQPHRAIYQGTHSKPPSSHIAQHLHAQTQRTRHNLHVQPATTAGTVASTLPPASIHLSAPVLLPTVDFGSLS